MSAIQNVLIAAQQRVEACLTEQTHTVDQSALLTLAPMPTVLRFVVSCIFIRTQVLKQLMWTRFRYSSKMQQSMILRLQVVSVAISILWICMHADLI